MKFYALDFLQHNKACLFQQDFALSHFYGICEKWFLGNHFQCKDGPTTAQTLIQWKVCEKSMKKLSEGKNTAEKSNEEK